MREAASAPTRKPVLESVVELLEQQAGSHFDPHLVPLFLDRMPEILRIRDAFSEKERDGASGETV